MKGTVRKRRYPSGITKWLADLGHVEGKRVMAVFETREGAENYLRQTKLNLKQQGTESVTLLPADRILYATWKDRLAEVGASIDDAGAFYLRHHRSLMPAPNFTEIVREFMAEQTRLNSAKYVDDLQRPNLQSLLIAMEGKEIGDIRREDVQRWVIAGECSLSHQRNKRATVSGLLKYACSARYISINPIAGDNGIKIAKGSKGEVLSYGPKEMRRLLKTALTGSHSGRVPKTRDPLLLRHDAFLGYLSAALFCGLRPEEIKRTPLSSIDTAGRTLVVSARVSKTNKPRVIELSRVATAWFRLWRCRAPHEASLIPTTFRGRWDSLRNEAGLPELHDGLRHTFATMHYALHQNTSQLKALMGHEESEDTLFKHYRAVRTVSGETVTKKMAQEFWSLMPTVVRGTRKARVSKATATQS